MKRYLLFAWTNYEQSGGWNDLCGSFDSVVEAAISMQGDVKPYSHSWHVVDTTTMEIVATSL